MTFTILLEVDEIKDGYQEIFLETDFGVRIYENTEIESPSTLCTHTFTVTVDMSVMFVDGVDSTQIRLGYGAHGDFKDTWERHRAEVKIELS